MTDAASAKPSRRSAADRFAANGGATSDSEKSTPLELRIGRKVFGWVAVVLFILGGAFFIQLAVSRGWLHPRNRVFGMSALGLFFLAAASFFFRRGWRRYSEMLNSAGIVTFLLTGYYVRFARVFPDSIAAAVLLVTAFGGFLLAACYRSQLVGLAAALGGLAVPLLIPGRPNVGMLTLYLTVYYAAVLLLINLLNRAPVALIGWFGALCLFIGSLPAQEWSEPSEFRAAMIFLLLFFLLNLIDTLLAAYRQKRIPDRTDLVRTLLTPYICFVGSWRLADQAVRFTLCGVPADRFFPEFGWIPALILFLVYGAATLGVHRREETLLLRGIASLNADPEKGGKLNSARSGFAFSHLTGLTAVCAVNAFVFLAVTIPLAVGGNFIGLLWTAVAAGLLTAANRKITHPRLWKALDPSTSEELRRNALSLCQRREKLVAEWLTGWSGLFFFLGVPYLVFCQLLPNLYPVEDFAESCLRPLANKDALPIFLASLLLIVVMILFFRRPVPAAVRSETETSGGATAQSGRIRRMAGVFGTVGALIAWGLLTSETFSYAAAAFRSGWGGCLAVVTLWTAAALLLFAVGTFLPSRRVRLCAYGLAAVCFVKLMAVHWVYHPLLNWPGTDFHTLPIAFFPVRFSIDFLANPDSGPSVFFPFLNSYPLCWLVVSAALLGLGLLLRKGAFFRSEPNEYRLGLPLGMGGLILLTVIALLETHFFTLSDRSPLLGVRLTDCRAVHADWLLALGFGVILWLLGRIVRSRPIRTAAYIILFLEYAPIFIGEFFTTGHWRTNGAVDASLLNLWAIPALLYSLWLIGLGAVGNIGKKGPAFLSGDVERKTVTLLGALGAVMTITLLSFETVRFFTGRTWLGPADWTRLFVLSILWSAAALIMTLLSRYLKSRLLRTASAALLFLLLGKFFFCELTGRPDGWTTPFLNPYAAGTFLVSFVTIVSAAVLLGGIRAESGGAKGANVMDALSGERLLYTALFAAGFVAFWLSSSVDLFQSVRLFPADRYGRPEFLAQMSLSILWTVIASSLLAAGFLRRSSLLRWMAILLFFITTVKVLAVDMANIDQLYRVAAFFALAVMLALAAAAYQRFR